MKFFDEFVFVKIIHKNNKELRGCDCCSSQVPLRVFESPRMDRNIYNFLCEVCAKSYISGAYSYPQQTKVNTDLYQSIAMVGNIIRQDVDAFEDKEVVEITYEESQQIRENGKLEKDD